MTRAKRLVAGAMLAVALTAGILVASSESAVAGQTSYGSAAP